MTHYPYRLWLAVFGDQIPDHEMHAYWRLKDEPTPVLNAALSRAEYLYIGAWGDEHQGEEPQSGRCPSRRVFDWLFWSGTIDRFSEPVLDDQLVKDLLQRFAERPDDLPALTVDSSEFARFLVAHMGSAVLPQESGLTS